MTLKLRVVTLSERTPHAMLQDPEGRSLQCNDLLRTTELIKINTISYKNNEV